MNNYDPLKQINFIHQSLANNKRPIGIFISAGCPLSIRVETGHGVEALIPDIAGLTNKICEKLSNSGDSKYCQICLAVCSSLKIAPNIEKILSHVRLLKQIIYNGSFNGITKEDIDVLEKQICNTITDIVNRDLPNHNTPYHKLASWVGAIERELPVNIFTTNYDMLMEQAFEEKCIPYFDGFIGIRKAFFDLHGIEEDLLPNRWARLWKLHGSVNWHYDESDESVWRGEGETGVSLIHPSHLKYDQSRKMPYLAMIDRLKAFLKQKSCILIICGYSFNDVHLNEVIDQGLRNNPLAMAFGLLYGDLGKHELAKRLAKERSNLSLLARDGAIIGKQEGMWVIENQSDKGSTCKNNFFSIETKHGAQEQTKVNFNLGDFAQFASFLEDMIHNQAIAEKNYSFDEPEKIVNGGELFV